ALGRAVVIKLLTPAASLREESVKRFLREGRVMASLASDHVVRVFDIGLLDGGTPYIVMEHLAGDDLAAELRRRGALPIPEAIDIVCEAIEGVAAAHAVGVVHRDLKPSNLFLAHAKGGERHVKVLDFGVSKVLDGADGDLTDTSITLGTPKYMAPEQL